MSTDNDFVVMPLEPTKEMLDIIARSKWPEDWEVGKEAQMEQGKDIPPVCEMEIAYGQYKRLISCITRTDEGK